MSLNFRFSFFFRSPIRQRFTTLIFLLLVLFSVTGTLKGQTKSLLQNKVSIEMSKKPLAEVLKAIGRQGGFYFSYNSNLIRKDSLVSVSAHGQSVKQVLDGVLGEQFRYVETDKYVILQPPEKEKWYTISGFITDGNTGDALADVSVFERQQLASAITDKEGHFSLQLRDREKYQSAEIVVSKGFYVDTSVSLIKGYDQELSLTIVPETYALPDMVVTQFSGVGRSWFGRKLISSKLKTQSLNLGKFFVDKPYQFSFIPGVGTHGKMSGQVENKFSFNLLGGYTAGVDGVEVAGMFNIDKRDVKYVQAAGVFNVVAGNVEGIQSSGFSNFVVGGLQGVQTAGFMNKADKVEGVQASGFMNVAADTLRGVQAAGFMNGAKTANVQASGFINIAGRVRGAQAAGFINIADQVDGAQVAGFINIARRVKGVQVAGFVNVADSSDYPIGIINIIRSGEKALGVSVDDYGNSFVTLRSGGRVLYGIFGLGGNVSGSSVLAGLEAGIGAHLPVYRKFRINNEIGAVSLTDARGLFYNEYSVRVMPSIRVGAFELFAGAGYNVSFYNYKPDGPLVETHILYSGMAVAQQMEMRIGYKGGIQVHF